MDIDSFQKLIRTGESTDHNNVLSRHSFYELHWLVTNKIIPLKPKKILEIGIAQGGTTKLFSHIVANDGLVVALDNNKKNIAKEIFDTKNINVVIGDSTNPEIIKIIKSFSDFDVILIDGNHETDFVRKDTDNYLGMLKKSGLCVWHDIRLQPPMGIKPFWYNELKNKLLNTEEYYVRDDNCGYGMWYKT